MHYLGGRMGNNPPHVFLLVLHVPEKFSCESFMRLYSTVVGEPEGSKLITGEQPWQKHHGWRCAFHELAEGPQSGTGHCLFPDPSHIQRPSLFTRIWFGLDWTVTLFFSFWSLCYLLLFFCTPLMLVLCCFEAITVITSGALDSSGNHQIH